LLVPDVLGWLVIADPREGDQLGQVRCRDPSGLECLVQHARLLLLLVREAWAILG
jgi:hypothetical protein